MDVTTLAAGAAALLLGWGALQPEPEAAPEPELSELRRHLDRDVRDFVDRSRADGPDTEQIRCLADLLADRAAADHTGFGAQLAVVLTHRVTAIAALHALAEHCRANQYPAGSSWCTLFAHRLELGDGAGRPDGDDDAADLLGAGDPRYPAIGYSTLPGQARRRRRRATPAGIVRRTTTELVVIPSDPAPGR